MKYLDVR
jgi:hypothetical protein